MVSKAIVVRNLKGIHLRGASLFCEEALKYKCHIDIKSKNKVLNGKSILGVLGAGVKYMDSVEIICSGEEEAEALKALTALVESGLGEKIEEE